MGRLPETEAQEGLYRPEERQDEEPIQAEIAQDRVEHAHGPKASRRVSRLDDGPARLPDRPCSADQARREPIIS